MKKFLVLFVLLLACGGAVFYFGWTQFTLPANTHGVIFTKTRGWEAEPLVPGSFSWRWEKLIPGNFVMYVYPETIETVEAASRGTLPSARLFSGFLDGNPDFGYEIKIKVTYKIKSGYYPVLASEHGVNPENLTPWLEGLNAALRGEAQALARSAVEDRTGGYGPFTGDFSLVAAEVIQGLSTKFPHIEVLGAVLESLVIPDMELYQKGREFYYLAMDAKKEALLEESRLLAVDSMRDEKRMESLQKYGELITKYPLLIEYLRLDQLRENSRKAD